MLTVMKNRVAEERGALNAQIIAQQHEHAFKTDLNLNIRYVCLDGYEFP